MKITFVPVFFDIRSFFGATPKTTPQLHSSLFSNAFVPFFNAFVPFFGCTNKRNECGSQASICYIRAFKQKRNECAFVPFLFAFVPFFFRIRFFWRVSTKRTNAHSFLFLKAWFVACVLGMCLGLIRPSSCFWAGHPGIQHFFGIMVSAHGPFSDLAEQICQAWGGWGWPVHVGFPNILL